MSFLEIRGLNSALPQKHVKTFYYMQNTFCSEILRGRVTDHSNFHHRSLKWKRATAKTNTFNYLGIIVDQKGLAVSKR